MRSTVTKRSIMISGHKTSVSLEEPFWSCLKQIAKGNNSTLSSIVAAIESTRQYGNLSSAIRLFVLEQSRGGPAPAPVQHWPRVGVRVEQALAAALEPGKPAENAPAAAPRLADAEA